MSNDSIKLILLVHAFSIPRICLYRGQCVCLRSSRECFVLAVEYEMIRLPDHSDHHRSNVHVTKRNIIIKKQTKLFW